ncbi:colossin-A [Ceratobasidium sp. AG-Ba]|nr:colossin-A [Ceratobasidium sp. AG-Ba]
MQPIRPTTRSHTRIVLESYRDSFDALPEAPPPVSEPLASSRTNSRTRTRFVPFETPPDSFGRFRIYPLKPVTIADRNAGLEDFVDHDLALALDASNALPVPLSLREAIAPCPNLSTFYLLRWFWKQSNNSLKNREKLLDDVLLQPQFNPADLAGVDLRAIDRLLAACGTGEEKFAQIQGWKARSVPIQIPVFRQGSKSARSSNQIMVPGLHSRTILAGIRKSFSQNNAIHFHNEPFKLLWIPPGKLRAEAQEIMGEIYNSPAMIDAYKDVQRLKISDENCTLPRVVAAVMFGSDAAQLGPFSTQKAWMMYMWLGNLSKYERCRPNSGSCFDLAHIPSLPDSVKDEITRLNGRPPSASLLTHLRRELMHAVMQELLDVDFLQAWQHGIEIDCADGIRRRVFPRIFTYSADYPERHDNISRQKLVQRARAIIYDQHKAVDNVEVNHLLQAKSLVPTENAFSKRLLPFKFNFFEMFVVDLLHEIELGVWKSVLIHLIRIVYGQGNDTVTEFNRRFRKVPTFSGSTIRKFSEDVASLKRLAARDFEDILQCCPPVFNGLLPSAIDSQVQHLLFTLALWHGLAKLRLHTTATLKQLSTATIQLGNELRDFQDATNSMEVFETPRESNARQRRMAARAQGRQTPSDASTQATRKICKLNLNTPKFHMVGHYVAVIARFGTTDSFSTQMTELQHRKVKAQWFRTNMRDAISQMTQIGDIGEALEAIQRRLSKLKNLTPQLSMPQTRYLSSDNDQPYGIGQSDRAEDAINIPLWVQAHSHEPFMKYFIRLLKEHLLARITGNPEFSELGKLSFLNDRMYEHGTLRINYTSYDIRRQYDVVNTKSSCRFIILPNDTAHGSSAHLFLYAKVLGIYHARVKFADRPPKRMDFLWVRWLDYDSTQPSGWESGRLDRVQYGEYRNDIELLDAFAFVDPRYIIRACHLIPDFGSGFIRGSSQLIRDDDEGDWKYHMVNRFVDRDMLMRYLGGGVGHFNQFGPAETYATYEMADADLVEIAVDQRPEEDELGTIETAIPLDEELEVLADAGDENDRSEEGFTGFTSIEDADGDSDDPDGDEGDFDEELYDL